MKLHQKLQNRQLFAHSKAREFFETTDSTVHLGAGADDVAVFAPFAQDGRLMLTADFSNSKRIIEQFAERDFGELARYSVRQNVCDILGSGGVPRWYVCSVMFERKISHTQIESYLAAIQTECNRFNINIIGGDTKSGETTVAHGTLIGECLEKIWSLDAAIPGDGVFVSGPLGGVTASLCALDRLEDETVRQDAVEVLLETDVPAKLVYAVRQAKLINAGTDISDGLGYSLNRMMDISGVKIVIDLDSIPLHTHCYTVAENIGIPVNRFAYSFGGDFQFLFSIARKNWEMAIELGLVKIGNVVDNNSLSELSPIPDFGHLDFECDTPVNRFMSFANSNTWPVF